MSYRDKARKRVRFLRPHLRRGYFDPLRNSEFWELLRWPYFRFIKK